MRSGRTRLTRLSPLVRPPRALVLVTRGLLGALLSSRLGPVAMAAGHYRADGVRITHDPYAPGMEQKYGAAGATDPEGFDPYADSVGPGIYGGKVKRDASGAVVMGRQYQNHNPRPGPVYAGGGYTEMAKAVSGGGGPALDALLASDPDLVHEVSTGGATPLHMCGMSQRGQHATAQLIAAGADVEALDTYGYTPLMRMASNNLPVGAAALLAAGADPARRAAHGESALSIARESRAGDVAALLA